MKIKNYSKGRADFEVTIEPNKSLQLVRRIPIFVNLVSDSGNASIKDCMSDRDTFLSGACQTLDGDFSDLKRCRSVILTKDDNEENALEATGNLILEKNTENGQNHNFCSQSQRNVQKCSFFTGKPMRKIEWGGIFSVFENSNFLGF